MPFTKTYFDNMSNLRSMYIKQFPCGAVTVTVKAYGQEYNLYNILATDEERITFCYYDDKKSVKLPAWKNRPDIPPTAWPALTLPYEVIASVEFNPSVPSNKVDEDSSFKFKVEGFKAGEEKNAI